MLDLSVYGSARPFVWSHEHLIKLLSTGRDPIITNPLVLNAFRAIDRSHFTPSEHQHHAYTDKMINLSYGEHMSSPSTIAKLIQLLNPQFGGRYLHIGGSTGYMSSILGMIAGRAGKVYSMERIMWLWQQAKQNAKRYPQLDNLEFIYRDGQFGLPDQGPFSGIVFSYALPTFPQHLLPQLAVGGKLIYPSPNYELKIIQKLPGENFLEETQYGYVFSPGKHGIA